MHTLLQEMIHYRNTLDEAGSEPDAAVVSKYEDRYREIMQKAKDEYEYEPPVKYNMNGYNLYKRLNEDMGSYTLFLHDMRVPATNNLSLCELFIYANFLDAPIPSYIFGRKSSHK